MEVHHHSHTPRRKWTHYFREFLMLFLAVFCGFLAEYQLEHKIERDRAKVYAKNLYEELKIDTAALSQLAYQNTDISSKLDTLCMYFDERNSKVTNGMLYYYAAYIPYVYFFSSNSSTLEELKGAGNMRLMKSNVATKISQFDKKLKELEKEYQISRTEFMLMESLYFKVFDGALSLKLFPLRNFEKKDSVFLINPPLNNEDLRLINELTGLVKLQASLYKIQVVRFIIPIQKSAVELMNLLKKEYPLN